MKKLIIGGAIAVFMALTAPLAANATPYGVGSYTPSSSATCEAATFSHPAVDKPGLGVADLTVNVNGGEQIAYAPGTPVVVPFDGATVVEFRVFADYPGKNFKHQFGVTKVFQGECAPVVPEKPGPVTVFGEWVVGSFACGDTSVVESRTVTNVGHRLDGNVWVVDPQPSDRSMTETRERDLTGAEIASLECAVEPTPEEPEIPAEVETPSIVTDSPAAPEPAERGQVLAETGAGDVWVPLAAGLGAMVAGWFLLRKRRTI